MKKLISAASALAMAATMVSAAVPFATGAADASKGFELKTFQNKAGEEVSTTISAEEIAAGDVTIPIALYYKEATNDTQFIAAQWTVDSKDGDASNTNISFKGYAPGESYFAAGRDVVAADGATYNTDKIATFCGTFTETKRGVTFSDTSIRSMYSTAEKQVSWGCPNAWGSAVWIKPAEPAVCPWTGKASDDFPVYVFEATFKKGTPAGTYTIDFLDAADEKGVPAVYAEAGNPSKMFSIGNGLDVKGIDIVIAGDSSSTPATTTKAPATTTTPAATTTTADSGEDSSNFPIDPGFVIEGQDYTVKPGDDVEVEFILNNSSGHFASTFVANLADLPAGITSEFTDPFCYAVALDRKYEVLNGFSYQANVLDNNSDPVQLLDGEAIIQYTFHIPEDIKPGDYDYTLSKFWVVEYAQKNADHDISKFAATVIPGTITVEGEVTPDETTTKPAAETTTKPAAETTTKPAAETTTKPAGETTTKPVAGTPNYGDTDCNGKVNIADVVVLNKWLNDAKSYNMTAQGKLNADCCDEKGGEGLDKNDSDAIIRKIVHLVELPCTAADLK